MSELESYYDLQEYFLDEHDILIQTVKYSEEPEGVNYDLEMSKMLTLLKEHHTKFSHVFKYPETINIVYDNATETSDLGHFHAGNGIVTLRIPGSMKNFQNMIDEALNRKFFIARSPMEIISHEMSHAQHYYHAPDMWPDLDEGALPVKHINLEPEFERLKGFIKDDISEYATTNIFEFVAEYSTLVLHQGKDQIFTDELHDFFKKVY